MFEIKLTDAKGKVSYLSNGSRMAWKTKRSAEKNIKEFLSNFPEYRGELMLYGATVNKYFG